MGKIFRYLLVASLLIVAVIAGWVWVMLNWSYAEGERTGYIQKFSRKGWLCKTWEGEIALVTMPGAIPEKFEFTVRDEEVADKVNAAAGNRVTLSYHQRKFIPTTCFGETEYFVDGLRLPTDAAAAGQPGVVTAPAATPPATVAPPPAPATLPEPPAPPPAPAAAPPAPPPAAPALAPPAPGKQQGVLQQPQ
jgi:hypothetical protein